MATLILSKGYTDGFGVSGDTTYILYDEPACSKPRKLARLLWTTQDHKRIQLAAGRRVALEVTTSYFYNTVKPYGFDTNAAECTQMVSFVPEAGRSYDLKQISELKRSCRTRLLDNETGLKPPSLAIDERSCLDHLGSTASSTAD